MHNLIIYSDTIFNDYINVSAADSVNILVPDRQCETYARDTKMNEMMPLPEKSIHRIQRFQQWVLKQFLMSPLTLQEIEISRQERPLLDHILFILPDASCLLTSIPGAPKTKHDLPHLSFRCRVFICSSSTFSREIASVFAISCSASIVLTDHCLPKEEIASAFLENRDQQGML